MLTTDNTETPAATPAEPVTPQTDEQNAAPVEKEVTAEADAATPKEEKPETEKSPPQPHEIPRGVQRRIDRAIAQRAEARAREEMALKQVEELKAKLSEYQVEPQETRPVQEDPHTIARQLVQEQTFNARSNEAFEEGSKTYKDFGSKLQQLGALGLEPEEQRQFMEAVLDCEKPAEVLYYLGSRPDEAADLLALPERQQVRALAKLEAQLSNAPKISNAPPPIRPIGTRGSAANSDPEHMTQAEYEAWRAKNGARWAQ